MKNVYYTSHSLFFSLCVLLECILNVSCENQSYSNLQHNSPNENAFDVTIAAPFKDLIYNRKLDIFDPVKLVWKSEFIPVQVSYKEDTFTAEMRLRGGIRFCDSFPPLKLKLPKSKKIEDQTEFKIVTHGTHSIDPLIPMDISACRNSLATFDKRESHARENQIYDLSAFVLKYHLKNIKFTVRYLDIKNDIDIREKSYFIEDSDHAADRYKMKGKKIFDINSRLSWRAKDRDDLIEGISGDYYLQKMAIAYHNVEAANPEFTAVQISKIITPTSEKLQEIIIDLNKISEEKLDSSIAILKKEQFLLLKKVNQEALAEAVLFRLMLKDYDWNLFGITSHSNGIKNFELLSDGFEIFPIPYDFNESTFNISKSIITREVYIQTLEEFIKTLDGSLDGFLVEEMRRQMPIFAKRLKQARDRVELRDEAKASLNHFVEALDFFYTVHFSRN